MNMDEDRQLLTSLSRERHLWQDVVKWQAPTTKSPPFTLHALASRNTHFKAKVTCKHAARVVTKIDE